MFEAKQKKDEIMPHFILPVDELETNDATFNLQEINDILHELNKKNQIEREIKK